GNVLEINVKADIGKVVVVKKGLLLKKWWPLLLENDRLLKK
ncbi:37161_t:CDS:1, partial [Gigaspora margarita]